jgi:hypothetical protein
MKVLLISELLFASAAYGIYKLLMACGAERGDSLCILFVLSLVAAFLTMVASMDTEEPGYLAAACATTTGILCTIEAVFIRWCLNWYTGTFDGNILSFLGAFSLAVACIALTCVCVMSLVATIEIGRCITEGIEEMSGKLFVFFSELDAIAVLTLIMGFSLWIPAAYCGGALLLFLMIAAANEVKWLDSRY